MISGAARRRSTRPLPDCAPADARSQFAALRGPEDDNKQFLSRFHKTDGPMSKTLNLLSQTLRILCAVALLSVGFAHRPPELRSGQEVADVLALPDGTIPSLCLPGAVTRQGQENARHGGNCDACVLYASIALPTPGDATGTRLMPPGEIIRPDRARFEAPPVIIANAAPRAPPAA